MSIFILLFSFVLSLFFVNTIKKMAIDYGWHDEPDGRKEHKEKIPTMAGLAIIVSLWATVFMMDIFKIVQFDEIIYKIFSINIAFLILGIIDDVRGVSAKLKFFVQIIAGGMFYLWITNNTFILFNNLIFTNILFAVLAMFYFTLLVNSINFIDGLDGLCGGVSIIFSLTMFIISYSIGIRYLSYIHLALIGALMGFIIFNFYPAKIFMGDTGSLFLGSMYSISSIILAYFLGIKFIILIILFTYPFMDVMLTIIRRIKNNTGIFMPDNKHIHHIIKRKFHSQRKTVITIYIINIFYAILALLFLKFSFIWLLIFYIFFSILMASYFLYLMLNK